MDSKQIIINEVKQKGFSVIFIAIGTSILVFGVFFIYFLATKVFNKPNKDPNPSPIPSIAVVPSPVVDSSPVAVKQFVEPKNRVAFLSGQGLIIADQDGSNPELIYKPSGEAAFYLTWEWSPDNKQIVVSGNNGVIIDLNSKQELNKIGGRCHNWSPDGKTIIYESNGIFSVNPDGTNYKKISETGSLCRGSNDTTHWFHDSDRFVYVDENGLNVYNYKNSFNTVIFESEIHNIDVLSASVVRKGEKIAFIGRTKFSQENQTSNADIYLINSDGSELSKLTSFKSVDEPGAAIFSLDGKDILFQINNSSSQYNGISKLEIETRKITLLSDLTSDSYYPLSLSKDGKFLSFDSFGSSSANSVLIDLQTNKASEFTGGKHLLWNK